MELQVSQTGLTAAIVGALAGVAMTACPEGAVVKSGKCVPSLCAPPPTWAPIAIILTACVASRLTIVCVPVQRRRERRRTRCEVRGKGISTSIAWRRRRPEV